MESYGDSKVATVQLVDGNCAAGRPWLQMTDLIIDAAILDGSSVEVLDAEGGSYGCGIFDRRDPFAAWRRFSFASGVLFDEVYLSDAINEACDRRGEESCLRLVHSDADYLPGLVVEQFDQVLSVTCETAAVDRSLSVIIEILKERFQPQEIVILNQIAVRERFGLGLAVSTVSGNNLKGRWVEMDGVEYRLDWLKPHKPSVYLDQREQYQLVASLVEGRCVLDAFSHSGGFALNACKAGAEHVVALDCDEMFVKSIGAHAQRNDCFVETICGDVREFLAQRKPGECDCIIMDPPSEQFTRTEALLSLHEQAFRCLGSGGILATYARSDHLGMDSFERTVAEAAARVGREGRIFARTSQPFDFPNLLSCPEINRLKGMILQVE